MGMWNPWRGCHRYSEGCQFCYIHKGDAKRGVDTNVVTLITKNGAQELPLMSKNEVAGQLLSAILRQRGGCPA